MYAIILAAGSGSRLSSKKEGSYKQFLNYKDAPVFWHSARTFSRLAEVNGIIFVFPAPEDDKSITLDAYIAMVRELDALMPLNTLWSVTFGGSSRQISVEKGLAVLPKECEAVLIHDSARPFMTASLASHVAQQIKNGYAAVVPGISLSDTIKHVNDSGIVIDTPERASLKAIQTPQGFTTETLRNAHAYAEKNGFEGTDDAQLVEYMGVDVLVVDGEESNVKITTPKDLALLDEKESKMPTPCTGFGYDVHKYGGNRPFILGGVPINTDVTINAHSDGDTLLHALMDAMLGLIGGGDIGGIFPDTDPAYENISSGILLSEVYDKVIRAGITLCHVDITIIAQVPRIAPHRNAIAKNISSLLQLPRQHVNVKATTEEHLGFTGEKKGIKVACVVTGYSFDS